LIEEEKQEDSTRHKNKDQRKENRGGFNPRNQGEQKALGGPVSIGAVFEESKNDSPINNNFTGVNPLAVNKPVKPEVKFDLAAYLKANEFNPYGIDDDVPMTWKYDFDDPTQFNQKLPLDLKIRVAK